MTLESKANGDRTVDGGTHEKGLKKSISKFAKVINKNLEHKSDADKFFCPHFNSYTAVISVFMDSCQFEGATKDRLTNEDFGVFTFDMGVNWYSTNVNWIEESINLNLSVESNDELNSALQAAHALWNDKVMWNNLIRDYAVSELLSLKNESWLEEDDIEVTGEQFKDRMRLESITIYSDASFEFWHDDGDLFWGHSILISGSLSEGLTDADIPG